MSDTHSQYSRTVEFYSRYRPRYPETPTCYATRNEPDKIASGILSDCSC